MSTIKCYKTEINIMLCLTVLLKDLFVWYCLVFIPLTIKTSSELIQDGLIIN